MRHRRSSLALLIAGLTITTLATAISPAATLRFGTSCAHCHEGECSGRLSFARRPESAFAHIRRYAGPTDDALAQQLYNTLEKMKKDCSYPPLAVPALAQGLTGGELAVYRDPWSGDYFLPLPSSVTGARRLVVEFDGGGRVQVELIDDEFEPLIDRCVTLVEGRLALTAQLDDGHRHWLRLRPRGPLHARHLTLNAIAAE